MPDLDCNIAFSSTVCDIRNNRTVVYAGENKTLTFKLVDNETRDSFDLTGVTEIKISIPKTPTGFFPNLVYTYLTKLLSLGEVTILSLADGKFKVDLIPEDTETLEIGQVIPLEIELTINDIITIVQVSNALNVIKPLNPSIS